MKVILNQDVPKLGLKNEIKDVAKGYARNFLFSKNFVKPATKSNLTRLQQLQESKTRMQEKQAIQAREFAKNIAGKIFILSVEVGDKGQLFQAIDATQISDLLTKEGFPVNKTQIIIDKPIKELGKFEIDVKLTPEIIVKAKLEINAH